ncbi:hypothetical protein ABE137_12700 [Brevibacillus laterosporus]|uniref:hypothetical protein n=1 Tax=Brevibacillus phage Sundance TaxID=1691958 RepID=UPI0006BC6867|nr:hypothetical protein AVT09_gp032 [Brevibacillus phage Sundance]ALA47848.1 hypothetical protein SUNDANCE_32 [Brevibacillus phage Sundance]
MAFKNFANLKKSILEKAKEGVNKAVLPEVQEKMQKSIKKVVYDAYNPIEYHNRRMFNNGGLGDKSKIKGRIVNDRGNGFVFSIRNEAKAKNQNGELTPLIVKGQAWALEAEYQVYHHKLASYDKMLLYNKTGFTPYFEPRDFISHTKKNLNKRELAKKLDSYMNK